MASTIRPPPAFMVSTISLVASVSAVQPAGWHSVYLSSIGFSAFSSIFSPSRMSIARRVLPSRLELKSFAGSFSDAPFANVSLTTLL